ncbi:unnamed protein product [Ostreobium quekettii]|uniref:Uncharacterized protein n=1 Tax=Ostreobium quekettii TaxID=121088 RepID=A0A8S1IM36_9CHLO|nr:unnamed protein product [Ostreobium quekettii]
MGNFLQYILGESDPHLEDTCKEWKQVEDSNAELLHKMQPVSNDEIPLQNEESVGENGDDGVYEAQWKARNVIVKWQAPARSKIVGFANFGKACSVLALHTCRHDPHIESVLAFSRVGSVMMEWGRADLARWYKALGSELPGSRGFMSYGKVHLPCTTCTTTIQIRSCTVA